MFSIIGEDNRPEFPGLARGLVAVLLYYDGRRCLVSALRTLILALEGRTWTLGLSQDLTHLINNYIEKLVEENLTNKILGESVIALVGLNHFTVVLALFCKHVFHLLLYKYKFMEKGFLAKYHVKCLFTAVLQTMNLTAELDKLQNNRALGPPKHRKQVRTGNITS